MQKHQKVDIHEPADRPHLLRGEVALPERRRVGFQELVPGSLAPFRTGFETVLGQDILDRLAGNFVDPEPTKSTLDSGVDPRVR